MADTIQFELVSPERSLASMAAVAVRIPGAEGDLTAMAGHMPLITTLRPGVIVVEAEGGANEEFVVTGGFAEITAEGATVLAESSLPRGEVTRDWYQDALAEARRSHDEAHPGIVDSAAKLVADMVAMGDHIDMPAESGAPAP